MPDATAPADPSCLFCRIIAGEIPCHKVYEDGRVLSFLDIGPLSRGHTLVIPKGHYETLADMPDELAGACMAAASRISRAVMAATGGEAWNILQNNGQIAGQVVPHVHFHIIPRTEGDNLGFRWPAGKLGEEAKELLAAIKNKL